MSACNTITVTPARSVEDSLQQWKIYADPKDAYADYCDVECKNIKAAQEVTATVAAPHVDPAPVAARTPRVRTAVAPRRVPAVAGSAWGNFTAAIQQDDAAGAAKKQAESALCGDLHPALAETYKNK
ncbi:hypothetical protein HBI20_078860 [Parastagonospora nodorum]|nr:hypothetical protein HBI20_078860 [Parastagonospora nodorum]